MLRRLFLIIVAILAVSLAATNTFAGYPSRDSWLPIAGHVSGAADRVFYTTIYLTSVARKTNDVTLSFYPSAQPDVTPRAVKLQLAPNQTAAVDAGPQLVGEAGAIGAIHVHSSRNVIASCRIFSPPAPGAVFNAIPQQFAIGTRESTLLHVPSGGRYKLYAVETRGFPLYFSVMAEPGGNERRLYLAAHEQRSWDLSELFAAMNVTALRVTGVNGSGKIVIAATFNSTTSQNFAAFEMSLPTQSRHRMRWPESLAYIAVALAIIVAIAMRRGPRTEDRGLR